MMRVLVVGGAGYIGGAVTELLKERRVPFSVYDSLVYEPHYLKQVDFIRGDVRECGKLKSVLSGFTHVVWLAAIVGDGACEINHRLTEEVNQTSVAWLAQNFTGRIIFTSTCSVYGQHDAEVREESVVNPLSLYAKTKLEAERFLDERDSLILRLGTAFGLSDTYSRPRMDLVVNYMTANALTKGELTVFGGTQWRPLVHVHDIARTIVDNVGRSARGIYNIASTNIQIKDLAATVQKMTGCAVRHTEQKFQDQRNYHVSAMKALRDGVFDPQLCRTPEDGVREIAEMVAKGRITETENPVYFNVRHVEGLRVRGQFA